GICRSHFIKHLIPLIKIFLKSRLCHQICHIFFSFQGPKPWKHLHQGKSCHLSSHQCFHFGTKSTHGQCRILKTCNLRCPLHGCFKLRIRCPYLRILLSCDLEVILQCLRMSNQAQKEEKNKAPQPPKGELCAQFL